MHNDAVPTLFTAWQAPASRRYYPVGRLSFFAEPDGGLYEFAYIRGAEEAEKEGFLPFLAFPELGRVYCSQTLFPFFSNRLMPESRPEYMETVISLDLDPDTAHPIQILGRSGGARVTDEVELFPLPEFDADVGGYRTFFLAHGLRHTPVPSQDRILTLRPGEQLFWFLDCQNPFDPQAIGLRTDDRHLIGYLPNYLLGDAWRLLEACRYIDVYVARVGGALTPLSGRLLCDIRSCWPEAVDFVPLSSPRFEPISAEAHRATDVGMART